MNYVVKCSAAVIGMALLSGCATVASSPIPSHTSRQTSVAANGQTVGLPIVYAPGAPLTPDELARRAALSQPATVETVVDRTIFDPAENTNRAVPAGIAYFLPRQLAKVTAKRSETTLDKPLEKLAAADLALSVAEAKVGAAKAAIRETEDLLVAKSDTAAIRDLLLARLDEQKKALVAANTAAASKKGERDTARSNVIAASQPGSGGGDGVAKKYTVTLNIELMAPTADPRHGYRLSPRHSAFRDDEHKLSVSPGGLLATVDVVAADRTADILVELATFAGAITSPTKGLVPAGRDGVSDRKCAADVPEAVSAVVDLADPDAVADLNSFMGCMGARLKIVGQSSTGNPPRVTGPKFNVQGIVYRTPVEILVQIEKCERVTADCGNGSGWFPSQIVALSLPQAGPISYVRQDAGFMTRTKYATVFKDGILTTYDSNRPSEVLEVARTPMRVLNAFFDGASKIISIRTGQNTAQAGLTNSQAAFQQAQINLLAAQLVGNKQLTDAELALLQSQVALQSGQLGGQTQLSAAQLSAMLALRRDQAKTDAVNKCIGERVTKGEPYDSCLVLP